MSCALTELQNELDSWCQSYVRAFCAYDPVAIAAHWTFPALTTQAGRSFAFKSSDHFASNTGHLLAFYRQQNVAQVERAIIACGLMSDHIATMTVNDKMLTADNQPIAGWQASYVLQRIDGAWKAVMAVADGETAAWDARGTPLGG